MGEGWAITEEQRVNVPSLFDNSTTEGAEVATADAATDNSGESTGQEEWFVFLPSSPATSVYSGKCNSILRRSQSRLLHH